MFQMFYCPFCLLRTQDDKESDLIKTLNEELAKLNIWLKIYSSIPLKKTALCLKTSHFINKYDSPRSQLCQWPRLVHNCNQSFNPWPNVARFDSHLNIPALHLGIPGGIVNLEFRDVIDHLAFCL